MIPPAFLTHVCLGSVYAWSILNAPLTRELGVVVQAAGDWDLTDVVPVFSLVVAAQGVAAALCGKWLERVGANAAVLVGALCFGGGIALGGVGVSMHSLPLLYAGWVAQLRARGQAEALTAIARAAQLRSAEWHRRGPGLRAADRRAAQVVPRQARHGHRIVPHVSAARPAACACAH
jgi:hypothetical protein